MEADEETVKLISEFVDGKIAREDLATTARRIKR
ncbi:hypothetical protein SAMN04489806_1075 [Paramicrobacterium humi]|uniref:Uncharacterized protein n=1 Tax=Paramicrobacterium humi TaxID=640635 RepID=A0A1H4KAV5_9MICO|nr:hypothetical protein SAMN04489806_1075 [Microbacterium humi]